MSGGRQTDPSILGIVGELADLLGLAETVQRYLPTQRLKVRRRHSRLEKLLDSFNEALNDSRTALRVIATTVERHLAERGVAPSAESALSSRGEVLPRIGFVIPREELSIYRRGIEQLQAAIQKMTRIAFDLEATSTGVPDEVERYYKISLAGNSVLRSLRHVLDDHPESLPELVSNVDSYLLRCSKMLEERERWLEE